MRGAAGAGEEAAIRPNRFPVRPAAPRLVLVVDQLEELSVCTDPEARRAFLAVLARLAAGTAADPAVALVVHSLRADFVAAGAAHPELREAVRDAAVGPARLVGLRVEPDLVDLLLEDLGELDGGREAAAHGADAPSEAGRLPLLAHALQATWQVCRGGTLTVRGYRQTGGIRAADTNTADRVYESLGEAARRAAPWAFVQLVTVATVRRTPAPRRTPRACRPPHRATGTGPGTWCASASPRTPSSGRAAGTRACCTRAAGWPVPRRRSARPHRRAPARRSRPRRSARPTGRCGCGGPSSPR